MIPRPSHAKSDTAGVQPSVLRFVARTRFALALAICTSVAVAAIPLSTSTASTQNFDGMGTSATAALPADFRVDKPATVRTVGTFSAAAAATSLAQGRIPPAPRGQWVFFLPAQPPKVATSTPNS